MALNEKNIRATKRLASKFDFNGFSYIRCYDYKCRGRRWHITIDKFLGKGDRNWFVVPFVLNSEPTVKDLEKFSEDADIIFRKKERNLKHER